MQIRPIGIIHTPFRKTADMPIQPSAARGAIGTVEVLDEYQAGLKDLEGFERIWLIYWFHRAATPKLTIIPFLDHKERGLFSTRAPARPNPLGISAVRLLAIEGNLLSIADVDMLTETPLLDIKPYVTQFDSFRVRRSGWIGKLSANKVVADNRFERACKKNRRKVTGDFDETS
jgi:tRNA (adenine37-N6)-methyltransferase